MKLKLNDLKRNSSSTEIVKKDNLEELIEKKTYEIEKSIGNTKPAMSQFELVFFFDCSTSVEGTEKNMSNHFLKTIKEVSVNKPDALVTLVLFNNNKDVKYYRNEITAVDKLEYKAGGGTSLYDVLTPTISELLMDQISANNIPSKTIVTIMTDGEDTTSEKYKDKNLKSIIKETKDFGWEYIFLGPKGYNPDSIGIDAKHSGFYDDNNSLEKNFESIKIALTDFLEKGEVSDNWTKPLEEEKVLKITMKGK